MSTTELISFEIVPSSGVPIYRQLMEQIRRLVASNHLNPGELLPSIRHLASELTINQMTISKAYSLLEAEGVLQRLRGKGMMVSESQKQQLNSKQRLELLKPSLQKLITECRQLDISKDELLAELENLMES